MLIYNSENECYSRFIPIDQVAKMQEKIKKLEARLQNMPVIFRLVVMWLNLTYLFLLNLK